MISEIFSMTNCNLAVLQAFAGSVAAAEDGPLVTTYTYDETRRGAFNTECSELGVYRDGIHLTVPRFEAVSGGSGF